MPIPLTPLDLLAFVVLAAVIALLVTIVFFVVMIVLGVLADGVLWLASRMRSPGPT
jgi:hypothetical protein